MCDLVFFLVIYSCKIVELEIFLVFKIIFMVLYFMIIFVLLVGNMLVLIMVCGNRNMWFVINVFIFFLFVSDLFLVFIVIFINMGNVMLMYWKYGVFVCKIVLCIIIFCVVCSLLMLCCIVFECFYVIVYLLKVKFF